MVCSCTENSYFFTNNTPSSWQSFIRTKFWNIQPLRDITCEFYFLRELFVNLLIIFLIERIFKDLKCFHSSPTPPAPSPVSTIARFPGAGNAFKPAIAIPNVHVQAGGGTLRRTTLSWFFQGVLQLTWGGPPIATEGVSMDPNVFQCQVRQGG